MRDKRREGVGVCCSSVAGVEEISWSMPKERHLPSEGRDGGTRLRSSGGSDRMFETGAEVACVAGEVDWPEDSRCSWRRSRFSDVKNL